MKVFICFFLILSGTLYAQQYESYKINHGTNDGLPSSECYEIIQDKNGYIWFGTDRGVVRYNGYEFETFTTKEGLNNNVVFYLYESQNGKIWFYDLENQLSYYYNDSIYPYKFNELIKKTINKTSKPLGFYVDSVENIHFSFANNLDDEKRHLRSIDASGKETYFEINPCDILIDQSKDNVSALFSFKRKYLISKKDRPIDESCNVCHSTGSYSTSLRIPENNKFVNSIPRYDAGNGKLYFSYFNQLFLMEKGFPLKKIHEFSKGIIEIEVNDDDVYLGLYDDGLYFLPNGNINETVHIIEDCSVSGVFIDSNKCIWASTQNKGIYFIPHEYFKYHKATKGKVINNISGNDKEIVYSDYEGNIYDLKNDDPLGLCLNEPNYLKNIISFKGNGFLASLVSQFSYFYPSITSKPVLIPLRPEKKIIGSANDWYVTDSCLFGVFRNRLLVFSKNLIPLSQTTISDRKLNCLSKAFKEHTLFIGRNDGLFKFQKDTLTRSWPNSKLCQARISDLEFAKETLFIATRGEGLLVSLKGDLPYPITKKDGLVSNEIDRIHWSQNKLYVLSKQGISILSFVDSLYGISNYSVENGLISNEVNDVFVRHDTIWLATNAGIVRFSEKEAPILKKPFDIQLKSFLINDKEIVIKEHQSLKYFENNIEILYEALSYTSMGNINYRYILLGLDKSWKETKSRNLRFPNLAPGDYDFIIQYQQKDLSWSPPQSMFTLVIKKPIWEELWFFVLSSILILFLVFLYIKSYLQKAENKIMIQEQLLDLERRALQAQMNPHFIFNSMTSIQSLISQRKNEAAEEFLVTFSRLVRASLNHSAKTFITIKDEVKLLSDYLEIECLRFEDAFQWQIEIKNNIEASAYSIPPMVIQPFIENSINHGIRPLGRKGNISITFSKKSDSLLEVCVDDDGIGRMNAAKLVSKHHNSKGTQLVIDRMALLNKKSSVQILDKITKGDPKGTKVLLAIPFQSLEE